MAIIIAVNIMSKKLIEQKNILSKYDSYAEVIENYSFLIGWRNTIKCEEVRLNDYEKNYIFNHNSDNNDKIIFHCSLFGENYEFEQKGLFKNINTVTPFPEGALPDYFETHMEFRHYLSSNNSKGVFLSDDTSHEQIALSFQQPMNFHEIQGLQEQLDKVDYSIKFCWVDTYLSSEIFDDSKFAMGIPPVQTVTNYSYYDDYNQVYGFMLYDHDYSEKNDFDNPSSKFIEIISAQYDTEDNFMTKQIGNIHDNLEQKNELNVDKIKIIGVVLEKKNGSAFSYDEANSVLEAYDFINCIRS